MFWNSHLEILLRSSSFRSNYGCNINLFFFLVEIGCRSDSECPSQTACINQECINPCSVADPCGENAKCQVLDTLPVRTMVCVCITGYQGNAAIKCTPGTGKIHVGVVKKFSEVLDALCLLKSSLSPTPLPQDFKRSLSIYLYLFRSLFLSQKFKSNAFVIFSNI